MGHSPPDRRFLEVQPQDPAKFSGDIRVLLREVGSRDDQLGLRPSEVRTPVFDDPIGGEDSADLRNDRVIGDFRVDRDLVLRRFGLYFSDAPTDDALLNQDDARGEVDMLPAQSQNFGHRNRVQMATITIVR